MVIDTCRVKVFPSDSRVGHFRDLASSFLLLPFPPAKIWQQLLGHMASLEWFVLWGHSRMRPLQWHLNDRWLPMLGDPSLPVPLSPESVRWWL